LYQEVQPVTSQEQTSQVSQTSQIDEIIDSSDKNEEQEWKEMLLLTNKDILSQAANTSLSDRALESEPIEVDFLESDGKLFQETPNGEQVPNQVADFLSYHYQSTSTHGRFLYHKFGLLFATCFTGESVTPYVHIISNHGYDFEERIKAWNDDATMQKINNEGLEGANGDEKRGRKRKTSVGGGKGEDSGITQTFLYTTRKIMSETILTDPELCQRIEERSKEVAENYRKNSVPKPHNDDSSSKQTRRTVRITKNTKPST
jgi:hypothetical protein